MSIVGALLGILGGLTCAVAVSIGSFWLLCLGTLCAGTYNAFGLQYRFAAADMAPADWKPKAISWTLAGGILGGFIGPWAGKITRDIWAVEFAATLALSGVTLMHFWWALFLLGVGWNFLYIGGTTLLTETYKPAERAKVQGGNDFLVFGVQAVSSLSAGALVLGGGWYTLNLYAIPAVIVISLGVGALMLHRRRLAAAHP